MAGDADEYDCIVEYISLDRETNRICLVEIIFVQYIIYIYYQYVILNMYILVSRYGETYNAHHEKAFEPIQTWDKFVNILEKELYYLKHYEDGYIIFFSYNNKEMLMKYYTNEFHYYFVPFCEDPTKKHKVLK